MARPTAADLTAPLSSATDMRPLASILHVLGTPGRLEALQLLTHGSRVTVDLPVRADELRMLEEIGVLSSRRIERQQLLWTLEPEALVRIACCLAAFESAK